MFKNIIILCTILLISAAAMVAQVPSKQATTQPAIQPTQIYPIMTFEQMKLDLGDVVRGEVIEFEFPFVNTGTGPLKIDLVSSCDCTTTNYPKGVVAPGESGAIEVVFDSTEKEESEEIDIDIFLTESDPETGAPIIVMLQYTYNLLTE